MGIICTHLSGNSQADNTFSVAVLVDLKKRKEKKKALNIVEHNAFTEVERRLGL